MGIDESKLHYNYKNGAHLCNICLANSDGSSRLLHICRNEQWKRSHKGYINNYICTFNQEIFNFSEKGNSSFFDENNSNIYSPRRLSDKSFPVLATTKMKNKSSKVAQHFEYNHIPAQLSSIQNLHFAGILCAHDGLVIVHLARRFYSQFGIIDLNLKKFLGTFGRQPENVQTDSFFGQISPDASYVLIRIPSTNFRRYCTMHIYSIRTRELICELPVMSKTNYWSSNSQSHLIADIDRFLNIRKQRKLNQSVLNSHRSSDWSSFDQSDMVPTRPLFIPTSSRAAPILFAFDPRFYNSRGVVCNLNFDGESLTTSNLTIVKLPFWEPLATTSDFGNCKRSSFTNLEFDQISNDGQDMSSLSPHILQLNYSKSGHLIFCLFTESSQCKCASISTSVSANSANLSYNIIPFCSLNPFSPSHLSPFCSVNKNRRQDSRNFSSTGNLNTNTTGRSRNEDSPASSSSSGYSSNIGSPGLHASSEFVSGSSSNHERLRSISPNPIRYRTEWSDYLSGSLQPDESVLENQLLSICPATGTQTLHLAIYSSDHLQLIRVIRFDRPICPAHSNLSTFTFQESRCGGRISVSFSLSYSSLVSLLRTALSSSFNGSQNLPSSPKSESLPIPFGHGTSLHTRKHSISCCLDQLNVPNFDQILLYNSSGLNHSLSPKKFNAISSRYLCNQSFFCNVSLIQTVLSMTSGTLSNKRLHEVVLVYRLPPPDNLQAIARQKLLQICPEEFLPFVGLPHRILPYLKFKPVFTCSGSCLSRSSGSNVTLTNLSSEK